MLSRKLRRVPTRLMLATLILIVPFGLGIHCGGPRIGIQTADLGRFRLVYWPVAEERVSGSEIEITFEAKLVGPRGGLPEVIVAVASRSPDAVVVDADLRFGPHVPERPVARGQHGKGPTPPIHTPYRDTFQMRQNDAFPFDPSALAFTALDRFGGALEIESEATGRFRVEEIDGRHWFITPDGHGLFSAGINHVNWRADYSPPIDSRPYHENVLAKYADEEGWAEVTEKRLRSWSVNTIGAWSSMAYLDEGLPHTPVLSLNRAAPEVPGWPTGQTGHAIRDYFDPGFEVVLTERIEGARACAENPWCIGVFSDNELPWGPSVLQIGTYVDAYLSLPPGAPGKLELQAFFEERYGDIASFNAAWSLDLASFDEIQQLDFVEGDAEFCNVSGRRADRQAFVARVAERYYERVHAALRSAFPDLLILGSRFLAVYTAPGVVSAAAPYVDVVSINNYDWDEQGRGLFRSQGEDLGYLFLDDPFNDLETVHALSGRPVMISEWTVRTPTPDVDVLFPPFIPTVETQAERADRYEAYMRELLARPYLVGSHWFKYHDQPATGRGDGENSRFGVVDIEDVPYPELSERMTAINADLTALRPESAPPSVAAAAAATLSLAADAEPGALGQRIFSITQPAAGRTGFYIHIVPGLNLAAAVVGPPLSIDAGVPDANGVAPLSLSEDAVLAFATIVGDVACLRLQAEGSHGELACDGGFGHDVVVSQEGGTAADPPVTEAFLGSHSGPGAATLLVPMEFTHLPAGATPDDCLTSPAYGSQWIAAFSTGVVTSIKGTAQFDSFGENFSCGSDGADWRSENGSGMLVVGVPTFDSRVPGGDLPAAFQIADRDEACRP
jgi:agarase